MLVQLSVLSGAKTKQIQLQLPTIVGRGGGSKVKLPSSIVSRQHCEIYEYDGQIAVRDLGSSNGTVVNGHRIQGPTFVAPQDEVTIGPVRFQVAIHNESSTAPAEPVDLGLPPEVESANAAPSFEELPPATSTPQQANAEQPPVEDNVVSSELAAVVEPEKNDEESVLQYVKPQDEGERSFVGIVDAEETPDRESKAPDLGSEDASSEAVAGDDSSLQNFFESLDGGG